MSLHPSTTSTLADRLGTDAPACIDAAIARLEHELRSVPSEPAARAEWGGALDERLRRLAVKVLPTAKAADTTEWRCAMVDALADLPAMISLTAAKRAIHHPFRFIGEIEVKVREIAAELLLERELQLNAFRRHRDAIARALAPAPALPTATPVPVTEARRAGLNAYLRSIGVQTQFGVDGDTYQLEEPIEAAPVTADHEQEARAA